jgi:hypothetical protein
VSENACPAGTFLEVRKSDDWARQLRIVFGAAAEAALGQPARSCWPWTALRSLTSNNITYCQVGDQLGYWRFFPTAEPGMGAGARHGLRRPSAPVSTRKIRTSASASGASFPMGTHLLIEAGRVNPHGFSDESAHRGGSGTDLRTVSARRQQPDLRSPEREAQDSLLRGLYPHLLAVRGRDRRDATIFGAQGLPHQQRFEQDLHRPGARACRLACRLRELSG